MSIFIVYPLVAIALGAGAAAVIIGDDHRTQIRWPQLILASLLWPLTLTAVVLLVLIVSVGDALHDKKVAR